MPKIALPLWFTPAAIVILAAAPFAVAAVGSDEPQVAGIALPAARTLTSTTDVQLRFVEEGQGSGHVRVELTPERRALTAFEARSAAQQGFLEALTEPALPDNLTRITVVVRMAPANEAVAEHVVEFVHKGGRDWSVLAGE